MFVGHAEHQHCGRTPLRMSVIMSASMTSPLDSRALVSIVVPVYNGARYLADLSIRSVRLIPLPVLAERCGPGGTALTP